MGSKTNKQEYLEVGDEHSIYFKTYGNPKGINILFLHGGPGGSFSDQDKQLFDPEVFNVIFFDQRGSGRSKPSGCLQNNTTAKLVEDITKLLDHLKIDKITLFGGSWGSTLALLYAIENPNKVSALILRGVFTASKENRQHFENGGTNSFFPKAWKRFADLVPDDQKANASNFYFEKILSSNDQTRKKYSYELVRYGIAVSKRNVSEKDVEQSMESTDFVSKAVLQSHYSINNFFLPDNYIKDNLDTIKEIPSYIVQGKNDMICPPKYAIEIAEKLPQSELFLVNAGHSSQEPEITSKLASILNKLPKQLNTSAL